MGEALNISEMNKESIEFIESDLIPEMVHNRCFCKAGSREFVELESVLTEPLVGHRKFNKKCQFYKCKVVIAFSGEPQAFHVIVKLLPADCEHDDTSYGYFLNEEMFYNKMIPKYKHDIYPKCYAADMGRYGRPVIVLEDLRAVGYNHHCGKLDDDHRRLLLEAIATFHGCGINLKEREFDIFREFYAKLNGVEGDQVDYLAKIKRLFECLTSKDCTVLQNSLMKIDSKAITLDPKENPFFTICHGNLGLDNSLFLYKDEKPISVKIVGWNRMTYTCLMVDLEYILIEKTQGVKSPSQIHKNCYDYIDALVKVTDGSKKELLSSFLLAFVDPHVHC